MVPFLFLSFFANVVWGWPSWYSSCDWDCISQKEAGSSFGNMGIDNFMEFTGQAQCHVTTSIPEDGYIPGNDYDITVSIAAIDGATLASLIRSSDSNAWDAVNDGKSNSRTASWSATDDSFVQFKAICGGASADEMYVSSTRTVCAFNSTLWSSNSALCLDTTSSSLDTSSSSIFDTGSATLDTTTNTTANGPLTDAGMSKQLGSVCVFMYTILAAIHALF